MRYKIIINEKEIGYAIRRKGGWIFVRYNDRRSRSRKLHRYLEDALPKWVTCQQYEILTE